MGMHEIVEQEKTLGLLKGNRASINLNIPSMHGEIKS
jgi:hypothetical protein